MAPDSSGDWKLPWEGGCRCGRVRFKVTEAPIMSMACHCAGCQSMSASAFSLSLMIPMAGLEITQGETVAGGLQESLDHRFCAFCKTWMFTAFDRAVPFVNLRPTMLDDHAWFAPFTESCTEEKLPWAVTGAKHSFPQFPSPDARPALMAEFAAEGARPKILLRGAAEDKLSVIFSSGAVRIRCVPCPGAPICVCLPSC